MKADAALAWPEGNGVLNAIAFKTNDMAIIHANRHAHDEGALRNFETLCNIWIEFHRLRRFVKLHDRIAIKVRRIPKV